MQLYQPTEVQGEFIKLPYLPQEMFDIILDIKEAQEQRARDLQEHKNKMKISLEIVRVQYEQNLLGGVIWAPAPGSALF